MKSHTQSITIRMKLSELLKEKERPTTLFEWMAEDDALHVLSKWYNSKSGDVSKAIDIEWLRNKKYFEGEYTRDATKVKAGKSSVKKNKIFEAIKSVVPFVTSKPAQPVCYPTRDFMEEEKSEESKKIAHYCQEILKKFYESCEIQYINEQNAINRYIYKIGLIRYGVKDSKMTARIANPKNVIFDTEATKFSESIFVGEKVKKTKSELLSYYAGHKNEKEIYEKIKKAFLGLQTTRVECIEWWSEYAFCFSIGTSVILELKKNPLNYELDDEETKSKRAPIKFYESSFIPYVALNVFNTGDSLLDPKTEIDLAIPMQDELNDMLRLLSDSLRFNGIPAKLATGMSENEISKINALEAGDSIIIDETQSLSYLQASTCDPKVIEHINMMESGIDAIFGTQATFRGEFEGVQSGVSRDILRQQAANSLAQLSRGIERMMASLYKNWLSIIIRFANDPDFVEKSIRPILWDKTDEFITLLYNSTDDGIEVKVLPGSILPDDPVTMAEQAMELAKMGRITNELLYERIGIPNAAQEAEKLEMSATVNAIKAQKLQQEAQSQQMTQDELGNINKEIDSIGDEWPQNAGSQIIPGALPLTDETASRIAQQPTA